jgi:hypothetical protein
MITSFLFTVMLTFFCRDRPVAVLSKAVILASPCVPRVQRSYSVPKGPLINDRSIAFLSVLKAFLSVLKRYKFKSA